LKFEPKAESGEEVPASWKVAAS